MENGLHHQGIKAWAEEDRPREKLLTKGKSVLSDAELIAILIGSGTRTLSAVDLAKMILSNNNNSLGTLARLSVQDLMKFKGIGEAKAIAIVSALELGRRRKDQEPDKRVTISSAKDTYELMRRELQDLSYEEFWIVLLRRNNTLIKKERISQGGVSGTIVDPKIIMKKALEELACSIILVHNHPSGNLKPSQSDIQLTKKLKSAGQLLDTFVLDHIIFTDHGYFSFAEDGLL